MLQDRAALRVYTSKNSDFHGKTVEVVHDYGLHKLEVSNCVANLPRLLIPNRRLLLIGLSVMWTSLPSALRDNTGWHTYREAYKKWCHFWGPPCRLSLFWRHSMGVGKLHISFRTLPVTNTFRCLCGVFLCMHHLPMFELHYSLLKSKIKFHYGTSLLLKARFSTKIRLELVVDLLLAWYMFKTCL